MGTTSVNEIGALLEGGTLMVPLWLLVNIIVLDVIVALVLLFRRL